MLERDMEELIARYPEEFFPHKGFKLRGRQQSFQGVGRFDLLFDDSFGTMILMELKARQLKYEDATQVAKYKDALERAGCGRILMWLVAPRIPKSVRDFLDDVGMEYSEIHTTHFENVATEHKFSLSSSETEPRPTLALPTADARNDSVASTASDAVERETSLAIPVAMERAAKKLSTTYGNRIPRATIIEEVLRLGNFNSASIIPSDFCYNRRNKGSRSVRLFIWHPGGQYEYVGPEYDYKGPVIAEPQGRLEQPYSLIVPINESQLRALLDRFSRVVRRQIDKSLARKLAHELLDRTPPRIENATLRQLARWCKTNSPLYGEGMEVARELSQLLFGTIVDREELGT